jgi:hypothetical protein
MSTSNLIRFGYRILDDAWSSESILCCRRSIKKVSMRVFNSGTATDVIHGMYWHTKQESGPGTTSSIDNAMRLNGSFESERRCDLIVERSTIVRDVGNMTGSRMTVHINGSVVTFSHAGIQLTKQ